MQEIIKNHATALALLVMAIVIAVNFRVTTGIMPNANGVIIYDRWTGKVTVCGVKECRFGYPQMREIKRK